MEPARIADEMRGRVGTGDIDDSYLFAQELGVDHNVVVAVINSLDAKGFIARQPLENTDIRLTSDGEETLKHGSPEVRAWEAVPEEGIKQDELVSRLGQIGKLGASKALAAGFTEVKKVDGAAVVFRKHDAVQDVLLEHLKRQQAGGALSQSEMDALRKRKLIQTVTIKSFKISRGSNYDDWGSGKTAAADLTPDMITQGSWKDYSFKPVNLEAMGKDTSAGHLHPLMKVRTQFREIFLEMGFQEMSTNRFVESSFWNFDALFQPQQHPARDMHDTFFVKEPARTPTLPMHYLDAVKRMHSTGGFGSTGWRYDWSEEESRKNLLRTHTTAVSSRTLFELARQAKDMSGNCTSFKPGKYFSIDRVFRNEALDATHLAEFHQVEGFIIDRNLTLGHLLGVLQEFFGRLGMGGLKFKPTYNPYTEPSLEVHAWHEGLGRIVEVGNSGVFRPEMLRPMGFADDVSVIAWGLSLERPTMIRTKVDNIRDLFGHKVNVAMTKSNPICRIGYE